MTEYRVGFEAISHKSIEDLSRAFYEVFDGVLAERDGRIIATVYCEGSTPTEAAWRAVSSLEQMDFSICRLDQDLVDGPEIAERLGVTRQAVQNWAKGTRGSTFPRPIGTPGGRRIWAWSQIVEWARRERGLDETPGLSLDEAAIVDADLARRRMHVTSQSPSVRVLPGGMKPNAGYLGSNDYGTGRPVYTAQR